MYAKILFSCIPPFLLCDTVLTNDGEILKNKGKKKEERTTAPRV